MRAKAKTCFGPHLFLRKAMQIIYYFWVEPDIAFNIVGKSAFWKFSYHAGLKASCSFSNQLSVEGIPMEFIEGIDIPCQPKMTNTTNRQRVVRTTFTVLLFR